MVTEILGIDIPVYYFQDTPLEIEKINLRWSSSLKIETADSSGTYLRNYMAEHARRH